MTTRHIHVFVSVRPSFLLLSTGVGKGQNWPGLMIYASHTLSPVSSPAKSGLDDDRNNPHLDEEEVIYCHNQPRKRASPLPHSFFLLLLRTAGSLSWFLASAVAVAAVVPTLP